MARLWLVTQQQLVILVLIQYLARLHLLAAVEVEPEIQHLQITLEQMVVPVVEAHQKLVAVGLDLETRQTQLHHKEAMEVLEILTV